MTDAFTPGPWHYQEAADAYTHIVRAGEHMFICQFPQGRAHEGEGNARLTSAAPDGLLLATLVVEYFGERPDDKMDTDQRLFDIATDLIAKARGHNALTQAQGKQQQDQG